MTTTIQISQELKKQLNSLKKENETYEQVISKLINKQKNNMLLMERAIKYGKSDLAVLKEWEALDNDSAVNKDWVWENEKSSNKKK